MPNNLQRYSLRLICHVYCFPFSLSLSRAAWLPHNILRTSCLTADWSVQVGPILNIFSSWLTKYGRFSVLQNQKTYERNFLSFPLPSFLLLPPPSGTMKLKNQSPYTSISCSCSLGGSSHNHFVITIIHRYCDLNRIIIIKYITLS